MSSQSRGGTGADASTASTGNLVLRAEDVQVSYGKVTALRGVDLELGEGELVSLIGPNGAGKTTFCDTVNGFLPFGGSVQYRGMEVGSTSRDELVDRGMIYCTEERDLFGFMDVEDNLRLGAYAIDDEDYVDQQLEFVYDLFPRLEERTEQNARSMSGGEQQMLAIGRALMGDPDLLVLDEPTIGLAPVILEDISQAIDPIQEQGVSILLTEQNVTFALDHADRMYLLENGEVVKTGTPEQLRGDDYIRETYLGG